jgi:hypothetical protein
MVSTQLMELMLAQSLLELSPVVYMPQELLLPLKQPMVTPSLSRKHILLEMLFQRLLQVSVMLLTLVT